MSTLLKSLLETAAFEPEKDVFDANAVHDKLDKAADLEEVETVTFGLETDDDKIVKVYVAVEDADAFEEALSKKLGEEDNIEDLLDGLSTEFDIVDVEWPDDEDDEDDGDDEDKDDGSASLNQEIDYDGNGNKNDSDVERVRKQYFVGHESLSLGQRFLSKVVSEDAKGGGIEVGDFVMIAKSQGGGSGEVIDVDGNDAVVEFGGTRKKFPIKDLTVKDPMSEAGALADPIVGMDPEANDFIARFGTTSYKRLALATLVSLGLSADMLDIMRKRNPILIRDLGERMREIGGASRMRIAQALGINAQSGEIKEDGSHLGIDTDAIDLDDGEDDGVDAPEVKPDTQKYGREVEWKLSRDDDELELACAEITVKFDEDTSMDIIDAIGSSRVIRAKDIDGNGPFVFSPRGREYVLKTPENKDGFRIPANIIDKILD